VPEEQTLAALTPLVATMTGPTHALAILGTGEMDKLAQVIIC